MPVLLRDLLPVVAATVLAENPSALQLAGVVCLMVGIVVAWGTRSQRRPGRKAEGALGAGVEPAGL